MNIDDENYQFHENQLLSSSNPEKMIFRRVDSLILSIADQSSNIPQNILMIFNEQCTAIRCRIWERTVTGIMSEGDGSSQSEAAEWLID